MVRSGSIVEALAALYAGRLPICRCIGVRLAHSPAIALVASLLGVAPMPSGASQAPPPKLEVVEVARGFDHPWAMAFLPSGEILVTERSGRLRIVRHDTLLEAPVGGLPTLRSFGQGGLLDIALHPDFATNHWLFLTAAKVSESGRAATVALLRATLRGDSLIDVAEVFEAVAWASSKNHFGSRLCFDANGMLLMTIGDRDYPIGGSPEDHPAQLYGNHLGKVVRLSVDGDLVPGGESITPMASKPEIWTVGHRNPQGIATDRETGQVWVVEHGPSGGDELNALASGGNYGWPVLGHGVAYNGSPLHNNPTSSAAFAAPSHWWRTSIGPADLLIYDGDYYPGWKGSFLVAGLVSGALHRLEISSGVVVREQTVVEELGRVRAVDANPDGVIYLLTDRKLDSASGRLLRLVWSSAR